MIPGHTHSSHSSLCDPESMETNLASRTLGDVIELMIPGVTIESRWAHLIGDSENKVITNNNLD